MAKTPAAEPIRLAIIRVDEMKPEEAEHRQLEGESLVEAAKERVTDVELMREALEALEWALGFVDPEEGPALVVTDKARARAVARKLEERLLNE
jgi:hypothetical protein